MSLTVKIKLKQYSFAATCTQARVIWLWPCQSGFKGNWIFLMIGVLSLGVATRGRFRGGVKGALFLVFVKCFCNQQHQSVWQSFQWYYSSRLSRLAIHISDPTSDFVGSAPGYPSLHRCEVISLTLWKRHLFYRLDVGFFFLSCPSSNSRVQF